MMLHREIFEPRGAFDSDHLVGFLSARQIDGVESVASSEAGWRYARTLHLPSGAGAFEIQCQGNRFLLTGEVRSSADIECVRDVAMRMLDLHAPVDTIDAHLNRSSALGVDPRAGIRVPGATNLYEILLRAIIGQQISVERARKILVEFTRHLGTAYRTTHPAIFGGLGLLFPEAPQVVGGIEVPAAGAPLDPERILRLPRRSMGAVVAASAHYQAGVLSPETLTDLPGVGPWTAAYVRLRLHEDSDAWLYGDVALVAGAKRLGILPADLPARSAHRELARISEQWRPWRGYAAMRLWAASASLASREP